MRQSIKGDVRVYGKKHERKRISREARKRVRQQLRGER